MTSLAEVADVIRGADQLALACHHHPDGDALGSMLAMHHLCAANGKASVASWPEPFVVGPHYEFLPGLDQCRPPSEFPADPEVLITFDLGSPDRLGELAASAERSGAVVVLDHHRDNTRFGTHNIVMTDVAATAVVVRMLADELGWKLTRDAALCLYVGLVTDTGRFQYVQLMSMALARAELDLDRRFVSAWLTQGDLDRYDVSFDETEGFIDHLRGCAEAEVSCVLKEAPGEGLRVSLRSTGGIDVGEIAKQLGGGGHAFMSGFVSEVGIPETVARIRRLIPE